MAEDKDYQKLGKRNQPKGIIRVTKNGIVEKESRVEAFMKEFIKNGGNATRAAMAVGNYTTTLAAAQGGSYYLKKAKKMGLYRTTIEKKGYHLGKLMDIALEKMEASDKPGWWDRIMKLSDYEDFTSTGKAAIPNLSVTNNIFGAHRKLSEEYIEGEVVDDDEAEEKEEFKKLNED